MTWLPLELRGGRGPTGWIVDHSGFPDIPQAASSLTFKKKRVCLGHTVVT